MWGRRLRKTKRVDEYRSASMLMISTSSGGNNITWQDILKPALKEFHARVSNYWNHTRSVKLAFTPNAPIYWKSLEAVKAMKYRFSMLKLSRPPAHACSPINTKLHIKGFPITDLFCNKRVQHPGGWQHGLGNEIHALPSTFR